MAPPFVFPQILRALEEDPEDNHRLFAQNPVDVTSLRPSDLEEFVKGKLSLSLHCMSVSEMQLREGLDLLCNPNLGGKLHYVC